MDRVLDTRPFDATLCGCEECARNNIFILTVLPPREAATRTPWAVFCRACGGLVHLTAHEYSRQLSRSDDLWQCPRCGDEAEWSDDEHKAYEQSLDDAAC